MRNQLFIRHTSESAFLDLFTAFGVVMGDGFADALNGIAPLKDFITFNSRVLTGKEYRAKPVLDSRELTLQFHIFGDNPVDYRSKKELFAQFLASDPCVTIYVPQLMGEQYIKLIYTGKSVTYSEGFSGARGSVLAKFVEPDPTDRENVVKTQEYLATEEHIKLFGDGAFLVP